MISTLSLLSLAGAALAAMPLPPRYHNSTAGSTFLYSSENSGTYPTIPVQALQGQLIFTKTYPQRVCPCSSEFGADNFTAYYAGTSPKGPTLQLFTSSPSPQRIYVDRNLTLRYTRPGGPLPAGANATSIATTYNEPSGNGLPSTGALDVDGTVTQANGTKTPYNALMFCAPAGSPPGTANGPGPLTVEAFYIPDTGVQKVPENCISAAVFTSVQDPKVAPYYIVFNAPQEPPVTYYE